MERLQISRLLAEISAPGVTKVVIQDAATGQQYEMRPDSLSELQFNFQGQIVNGVLTELNTGATIVFQGGREIARTQPVNLLTRNPNTAELDTQKAVAEIKRNLDGQTATLQLRLPDGTKLPPLQLEVGQGRLLAIDDQGNMKFIYNGREMILDDHARLLQELLDEARNQGPSFQGIWTGDSARSTFSKIIPGSDPKAQGLRDQLREDLDGSIAAFQREGVIGDTSQIGVKANLEQIWRKFEYPSVSDPTGMTTTSGLFSSGLRHPAEDPSTPYVLRADKNGTVLTVMRTAERQGDRMGNWDASDYVETEHHRLGDGNALVLRGVTDLKAPVALSNGQTMTANIRVAAESDFAANQRNLLLELTLSEGQSYSRDQIRIGFGPMTGGAEQPPQLEGDAELYRRYLEILQKRVELGTPLPFPTSFFQRVAEQMVSSSPLSLEFSSLTDRLNFQQKVADGLQQALSWNLRPSQSSEGN